MDRSITVDIAVEADGWPDEEELARAAAEVVEAVMAELGGGDHVPAELSILFADDARVAGLNSRWRGKDGPTNVLSFPAPDTAAAGASPRGLGDIVLARETIAAEAALDGKPFDHHLRHLIVHGLLHLLGHDHENEADAAAMEALERSVLARLAIPDPYR